MKLTDLKCKNAKPKDKLYRLFDGAGLYLEINPNGSKYWRLKYRFNGKEKRMGLGIYPSVSLQEAREKRYSAKKKLEIDVDPAEDKKLKKLELQANYENNFEALARRWHEQNLYTWNPKHADNILKRFEANIFPIIGKRPIRAITPPELLAAVERVQAKGNHDLAHRMMQMCSKVFRFAVARGLCDRDITFDLRGALKPVRSEGLAYLSEKELPEFLRKLDRYEEYSGKTLTKLAFQLLVLLMAVGIAGGLLVQVFLQGLRKVHAGLVGEADEDEEHISEFVAEVLAFVTFFFRLLAIAPCHDAGHFTNFFRENGHVGQLVVIAHTSGLYPLVNGRLGFVYRHVLWQISMGQRNGCMQWKATLARRQ